MSDESAVEMTPPPLSFSFLHGWCELRLRSGDLGYSTRATTLVNSFTFLLDALLHIANGSNCSSAIWAGEGSGKFIDLGVATSKTLAIVVHDMQDPSYVVADAEWLPIRAGNEFSLTVPFDRLWPTLADELARLRCEYADDADGMPHWGWQFPTDQHEKIKSLADSVSP